MSTQQPSERDMRGQRGATLIVTLGILTVLSIMAVTFLVTSRLQRQAAASKQSRFIARNYMDAGLYQAIRQIESAFTSPNYTEPDQAIPTGSFLTQQRLAPVGHWFSDEYGRTNDPNIAFQSADALASPTERGAPSINLLSPAVMRFVPAALTNGMQLDNRRSRPFRSGWIRQFESLSADDQLLVKPGRVAYLVFNCSGFADANTFASGPTTQKLQRICYSQADVTNWLDKARTIQTEPFKSLFDPGTGLDAKNPFFHLSYDPDPDVYPLHYDCFETCTTVGRRSFGAGPVLNLNMAQAYQAMQALKENATYWKFNINSLTNHFALGTQSTDTAAPWFNDANFKLMWLDPVTFLLEMMRHEEPSTTLHRWPDSSDLAWTIANFMDDDRIPQVSDFPTGDALEPELATRANYAVEDVPLINRISVFPIFKPGPNPGIPNPDAPQEPSYYFKGNTSDYSNRYAVAIELWYPFAPNRPPDNSALYAGIFTNAADVATTTNRPWTQSQMRDWFDWNSSGSSNSVMRTLFYSWARAYTSQIGPSLANHPLWQTVIDQGDLWFTPDMTNHPSWPVADTNGAFSISDTPIWKAFYPDTYGIVTTNETGAVTTNVYTFLNVTNAYVEWVSEPDQSTNRLVGPIGTAVPEPYPVLLWSNLTTSVHVTNVLGAILTPDDTLIPFVSLGVTNRLVTLQASPEGIGVTVSNELTGVVTTNSAVAFAISPVTDDGVPLFAAQTNLYVTTEILPVEPLPMPDELGRSLNALFALLPTNSLSALYTYLLLRPAQFDDADWRSLFDYFTQNPSIVNTLMPAHRAPTLGSLTEEDRYALTDASGEPVYIDAENGSVTRPAAKADQFGLYWVVYPKKTVSFPEITEVQPVDGSAEQTTYTTNFCALGSKEPYRVWLRPAVTVHDRKGVDPEEDVIVDEALLTPGGDNVQGWHSVTNVSIPDPRNNAYASRWQGFDPERWTEFVATTNLSTQVRELPFIHFDAPFTTIGDLGHIYTSYDRGATDPDGSTVSLPLKYDTLTFSTRAGAALLDIFTLSTTNRPKRGLVQANTQQAPVIKALLADVKVGWTNGYDNSQTLTPLRDIDLKLADWANVYSNALANAPYSMGWRSYADMLPSLSTNRLLEAGGMWNSLHPMHDYAEDVLRGLVDKVSFRQNIFVIVVAAQALSPASTDRHPITLAEQRAAVTVIRDAYTGKWLVHSWVWLTESPRLRAPYPARPRMGVPLSAGCAMRILAHGQRQRTLPLPDLADGVAPRKNAQH